MPDENVSDRSISQSSNTGNKNEESSSNSKNESSKNAVSGTTRKSFLGGYRHKLSGKIYHHAIIQTPPSPWKYGFILRFNRDAQTVESRDKAQQTSKDASTQVEARNLYIRTGGDKTLAATDNYVYADDIKKEYLNKITRLQAYIRNWLAFKELLRRKQRALEENEWEKKQAVAGQFKDTDWLKDMEKRRLHPKSEDDFKLIFSDLQKWWNSESKSISEVRSGADCKAAMWMLLNEEASKIEEVNKKKNKFENENFSQNREKVLKRAAKSKVWRAYEDTVEVQTSTTLRARYLHDLYQTLSMKYLSAQDRVDVLTNLKKVLKPYHSKMTDNLVQLANREIDLHLRGIKNTHLGGLQNRICNLFWQFVKKPTFNPEMQSLKKMKTDTDSTPYIMCCTACKCFYILPINSTEDVLGKSVIENYFTKCKKCRDIENEAWIRKDLELYKRILKLLISEEEKKPSKSSVIYILQPSDVGHLVDKIWKHQSCIGGSREDMELELTRFDIKKIGHHGIAYWSQDKKLQLYQEFQIQKQNLTKIQEMCDTEACRS